MGSGVWFKSIIRKKKVKGDKSQKVKRYSAPDNINGCKEVCGAPTKGASVDDAATQIQTAIRAYLARKTFRQKKGMVRLQNLVKRDSVNKQASTTMSYLHSWSRIQGQIRERRVHMVTEGRLRQKKLENQLKLEAKLRDLEVEWSGGSETMDAALARIHQREEAAVRRERAMAYAFSHQWRANSTFGFGSGNHELNKENWGWSWTDRWIAARPWESRVSPRKSPKKAHTCQPSRSAKNSISPKSKAPAKVKLISPNGKAARQARKLSYESADQKMTNKTGEEKVKNEKEVSQ